MAEAFLHAIGTTFGGNVEHNTAQALNMPAAQCERMVNKTGVHSRPIATSGQTTTDLALGAVRKLLTSQPGLRAENIGALIVCTQTPDHLIPGVSSRLHGLLGLSSDCIVFDINQGCSGFVIGTQTVAGLLPALPAGKVAVLVNADTYSRLIRTDDLTTRVLFGDAAAASLFSPQSPAGSARGLRLRYTRSYADGSGYDLFVAHGSALQAAPEGTPPGIHMDGPAILSFALRVVPDAVHKALADTGLALGDVTRVIFHQANQFVVEQLSKKLGLRPKQTPVNCAELGNTVSASIPLLLDEQWPMLEAGNIVMTIGFGVGLSWGVAVFDTY